MNLFVAFRKEWMEYIRTYRLLIVAVVLIFFGLTSPLLAKFTPEIIAFIPGGTDISALIPPPTVWDAVTQYVKNMTQFGILLALLLTMGVVAQEKDKGTAAMILVKPMRRGAFISAKFLALAVTFAICLIAAGLACYYYTLLLFEAMNIMHWLVLNALLFLYLMVYVSITLFCSTLTKSQAAAGGVALGLLVVLGLVGAIPSLGKYLPGELISWSSRLMQGDTHNSWAALGVSVGLIAISLLASWLIFKKQEL
jgi:ABC-2 type transport system permease protein